MTSTPYELITTPEALRQACERVSHVEATGLDCETTDLQPRLGRLRLIQLSTPELTSIIDCDKIQDKAAYAPLKHLLQNSHPRKICHNAKFDQKWLKHCLDIELSDGLFDTQLAATLIDHSGSHNLESTAKKYLDLRIDKSLQNSDWSLPELSDEQLSYAARDANVLIPLRKTLIPLLIKDGLVNVAQIEFEAILPIAAIELAGVAVDRGLWQQHLTSVKELHARLTNELQEMFAAGLIQTNLFGQSDINLNSHPQVAEALRNMGVPIEKATRNAVLLPLKDDYPIVAKLLEYRVADKAVTSYGDGFLACIDELTGRVFPDFKQIGAPTGRTSCANPNVQQVPTDKQYRQCFRARAGRKLVICDYSQIELRILGEISGDEQFIHAFQSGADLHRTTASHVFSLPIENVTKEQRDFAKRLNFGVVYGIGAQRFGHMTGMGLSLAEETLAKYFQTYRQLDQYLREASNRAVADRCSRTLSGRLVRYRFDPSNRQAVSEVRRQGRNAPIQGTSADILKKAIRLLYHALKDTSAQVVNIIHDEIVVECSESEAEDIAERVSKQMVKAATDYLTNVPVLAEPTIADEWVK
jgi:DNA polymerase I-like protein with 3'-5' exonuclease and polymerase domains